MRSATIERRTKETDIALALGLLVVGSLWAN